MSINTSISNKSFLLSILHDVELLLFGKFLSPLSTNLSGVDMNTMHDHPTQPNYTSYAVDSSSNGSSRGNKNINKFLKKNIFFIIGIIFIVIIVGMIISTVKNNSSSPTPSSTSSSQQTTTSNGKPVQQLHKLLLFPLKDNGKEISKVKYEIQTAELADTIVVKGQTAKATKGRQFLIVSLKITNDYDKTININSRDYIRLIVNGSSEKLAADIHNDPVEVQAISTKYTRLGFPIYTADKNLELVVGEINGPKETIKLTLQ